MDSNEFFTWEIVLFKLKVHSWERAPMYGSRSSMVGKRIVLILNLIICLSASGIDFK